VIVNRRTMALVFASLALAFCATPLTPSVRAVDPTTWHVAHGDEASDYTGGSACADPDYATDGSWSVGGSGDGAYNSDNDAIQDAIDNAASGDTIFVCFGRYDFDTDLHNFDPGMNLTIAGDGIGETVFDGTDSTRLINSNPVGDVDDGGTLTLRDLSIEDARTASVFDNGGAVNADGLSLTRVSISGSDNAYNGGALYVEGNITIADSTFTDNDTSEYGAVVYAWNPDRTVSISNSVFNGNTAGQVGGAIYATTVTDIRNSVFNGNTAGQVGGAIYATTVTDTGSTFTNNSSVSGGAISATTVTLTGSTFSDNSVTASGGAILVTTLTVTGSTFTNNSSVSGGAVYARVAATVNRSTFTNNSASYGGAILLSSMGPSIATVNRSTFTNNSADIGGAISSRIVNASANTFTDNHAENTGGAIYAYDSATITSSSFVGNDAGNEGGAIHSSTATISRSRFTRNTASEHGGAVILYLPTSDDLQKLRGNTFSRNAAESGGAITLGSCVAPSRSQAARVLGANRFSGNRATQQRPTNNIERLTGACA
jgi:predicted outer membrane repeat protein